jgi:hypothetical protein
MLIINGLQLDFKKFFLELLVNLVNNIPDPTDPSLLEINSPIPLA